MWNITSTEKAVEDFLTPVTVSQQITRLSLHGGTSGEVFLSRWTSGEVFLVGWTSVKVFLSRWASGEVFLVRWTSSSSSFTTLSHNGRCFRMSLHTPSHRQEF